MELHNYALIKTLYDQGDDYIDSFWPLVLEVLPENTSKDITTIKSEILKKFQLDIPIHLLKTIIGRAKKKRYLNIKPAGPSQSVYQISDDGIEYLTKLEGEDEVERRMGALIESIRIFFTERKLSVSVEKTQSLLTTFIENNLKSLIEFLNPSISGMDNVYRTHFVKEEEMALIDYMKEAQEHMPDEYQTIRDMVYGSIISALLYTKGSSELSEICSKNFNKSAVFLDTNIVFSLLDLHNPEQNEATKELISLLKEFKFSLKVFDFTVDEMSYVISGYLQESNKYPTTLKIDSIYSLLKRKGWESSNVKEFLIHIEEIIENLGIEICHYSGVDLKRYQSENENLRGVLANYKPMNPLTSLNHDLAAIDKVRALRKKSVRYIEDAEFLFLTSNTALQKFDVIELGHRDKGTITEVILDRLLANILWLKKPSIPITLKSIIAAHSRNLLINRKIYIALVQLRKAGRATDEEIATLFYHNQIEGFLIRFNEEEVDKITNDLVISEIEKTASITLTEKKKALAENKELLEKLFVAESGKEKSDQENIKLLRGITKTIMENAERSAGKLIYPCLFILLLIFMSIEYMFIPVIAKTIVSRLNQGQLANLKMIGISSDIGLFVLTVTVLYAKRFFFKKRITNWIYNKHLRSAGLVDSK